MPLQSTTLTPAASSPVPVTLDHFLEALSRGTLGPLLVQLVPRAGDGPIVVTVGAPRGQA